MSERGEFIAHARAEFAVSEAAKQKSPEKAHELVLKSTQEIAPIRPNPLTLWWFWVLIGTAVLVIVAAVLLAVYFVGRVKEVQNSMSQGSSGPSNSLTSRYTNTNVTDNVGFYR